MNEFAAWTDVGNEEGLDPLAMLNAVEVVYQNLLPGMSSLTTRLRQYAFHAWWITDYVDHVHIPSRKVFAERTRRVEYLFALSNAVWGWQEFGAGGGLKARAELAGGSDPLDTKSPTDMDTPPEGRYLLPIDGEFRGVWSNQMIEMGLLGKAAKHELWVPTGLGRALASAFGTSVGAAGDLFLDLVGRDTVSRAELASLAAFRFSAIPHGSEEERLLRGLLFGDAQARAGAEERVSPEKERTLSPKVLDAAARRGKTLRAIIGAARAGDEAVSDSMLRWYWLERAPDRESDPTVAAWGHYQTGDTVRVVYEALLRQVVAALERYSDGVPLSIVGSLVCAALPDGTLAELFDEMEARNRDAPLSALQARAIREPEDVVDILAPLARLLAMWSGRIGELERSLAPAPERQSAATELAWLEKRLDLPGRDTFAELVGQRVARRHLAVASRKLARQNSYTFLFDAENGVLRARLKRPVAASSPRLATALRFLADARLLKDGRCVDEAVAAS